MLPYRSIFPRELNFANESKKAVLDFVESQIVACHTYLARIFKVFIFTDRLRVREIHEI